MTLMMAALSGILPPFLERMDPRDWNSCAYRLRGFFLPDPGLVGEDENIVLDCYRLARWYHQIA